MEQRRNFILDVYHGIIDPKKSSWVELEKKYGYPRLGGYKSGELIRSHHRWFKRKGKALGQWAPGKLITSTDRIEDLVLKSKWQVQTKGGGVQWLESYRNEVDGRSQLVDFKRELIKDLKEFSPIQSQTAYVKNDQGVVYVISLPDLHFGKQAIEKTAKEFDHCFFDLISRVDNVKQYVLPIGNDLFQTEGKRGTTTKGTKVEEYSEWKECFRFVWKFFAQRILDLTKKAPVHIPIVQGNHDWERTFYLGDVLYAYFMNNANVTVDNSPHPRKYFRVGDTLMGWDHGEIKPSEYPLIMATERPIEFGTTRNRVMFTGHFHSQQTFEYRGIHVRFLPSICPADEWHKMNGYDSQRAAQGYKYNDEGLLGYEESRP